ncbi:MAG: hypothetical protein NVSMB25_23430 [Thermoleophilaceae bacterium]
MRRLVGALCAVSLLVPTAAAQATCPQTSVSTVEADVMCLQCGVPLSLAEDAPSAKQERAFIQAGVARCQTASQIKAGLVAQYGDRVLALPRASGFGLAAYLVPLLAFVAASTAIALTALRWRRSRPRTASPPAIAGPSPERARLDADLDSFDR